MAKSVKPCADRLAFPTFLAATPVGSSDLDGSLPNVANDRKKHNLPLSVPTALPAAQTQCALSLEPSAVFRHSIPGFLVCASSRVPRTQEELSGTNWRSNLRIAPGSRSPAAPVRVYVLSNPWGPSTRISQFSLARDPAMVTRQSPRLSLNACSMLAVISFDSRASPRLCSSALTPMAL
jgi:hypothetical protein